MSLIFGSVDFRSKFSEDWIKNFKNVAEFFGQDSAHFLSGHNFFWGYISGSHSYTQSIGQYSALIDARLDRPNVLINLLAERGVIVPKDFTHHFLVFQAFICWGTQCTSYLEGDFSIVVYDEQQDSLWMARDHLGILPLYYTLQNDRLIFAQLPSLLANVINAKIDSKSIAHYLAYEYPDDESTFFEDIKVLRAGHELTFNKKGITTSKYYRFRPEIDSSLDIEQAGEKLLYTLNEAVESRISNVGISSSMLSGGLDSSTVASLAARYLNSKGKYLDTYTYVPIPDIEYPEISGVFGDESPYVKKVQAFQDGIKTNFLSLKGVSIFDYLPNHLRFSGSLDIQNYYNWLWSQCFLSVCRTQVSPVLLSGQMGNLTISYNGRLFGWELAKKGKWRSLYKLVSSRPSASKWSNIKQFTYCLFNAFAPSYFRFKVNRRIGSLKNEVLNWTVNPILWKETGVDSLASIKFDSSIKNDLDLRLKMSQSIQRLANNSKTYELIYGVKELDPTADKRVLELSLSIPSAYWSYRGQNRFLIRNMTKGLLPDEVRLNQKKGRQLVDCNYLIQQDISVIRDSIQRWKLRDDLKGIFDFSEVEKRLYSFDINSYDPIFSTVLSRMIAVCLFYETFGVNEGCKK